MSGSSLLEIRNLAHPGFQPVSLELSAQELVCLSGPSGVGKTLLLRALVDLDVNQGEVCLNDTERERIPATLWRRKVAYLPAESRWWAATVGEHFPTLDPTSFARLGFSPEAFNWQIERLSSGERQRLAVLRVLANRPEVLLLDEPTANLDPDNTVKVERLVRDYLDQQRAACLWVTHAPDQIARIASRTLVLDQQGLHHGAAA